MSLNQVPSAERLHIGFFGMRNAGKSSLVNAVTGQQLSLVSDVKGTTTDPVRKAMELLPIGPVVIVDTPGMDDEGALGEMRVQRAKQALDSIHVAVLVVGSEWGMRETDHALAALFEERKIPYIVCYNKADILMKRPQIGEKELYTSAVTGEGVEALKALLGELAKSAAPERHIVSDLIQPGDVVLLVIPIDASAPKGRLILPQQQTIRDILDHHAMAICCQDTEVKQTLASLGRPPALVITDSQAFGRVSRDVPPGIPLTSFSILMARYKGNLGMQVRGAAALAGLREGDKVLISEGCTHHRQCGDIGSVKIPAWIRQFTGKNVEITLTSGGDFPQDLSAYALVLHCGGCMLSEQTMKSRMARVRAAHVPVVNYGVAIAHMHGILARSLEIFPDERAMLDGGDKT